MTARNLELLRLYIETGSIKLAAYRAGITVQGAKNHLTKVYQAIDADGAIDACKRLGWLRVPR